MSLDVDFMREPILSVIQRYHSQVVDFGHAPKYESANSMGKGVLSRNRSKSQI